MRGSNCVGCGEEDCSRQGAPEQRTTGDQKPLSFHFAQERAFSSELERRVRDGVYTERQDDRYGGRVPSKKRKAQMAMTCGHFYNIVYLVSVLSIH